jgi:hypothetical protein
MRGSPRATAIRGNSNRSCVTRKKRKVVMAIVPARKREPGIFRPYVVSSCRSRQAASSASNKHVRSAPKSVAVRVNGGLGGAASGTRVSGTVSIEKMSGDSTST